MQKRIIINASAIETRIALCEANALAELHVESGEEHSIVGNIYKGKVLRVLPGMQAAFVEIGLDKAAFMHVSDFWRAPGADAAEGGAGEGGELDLEPSLAAYAEEVDAEAPAVVEQATAPAEGNGARAPTNSESTPSDEAVAEDATSTDAAPADEPADGEAGDGKPRAQRTREESPMPSIEEVLTKGQEILVQV